MNSGATPAEIDRALSRDRARYARQLRRGAPRRAVGRARSTGNPATSLEVLRSHCFQPELASERSRHDESHRRFRMRPVGRCKVTVTAVQDADGRGLSEPAEYYAASVGQIWGAPCLVRTLSRPEARTSRIGDQRLPRGHRRPGSQTARGGLPNLALSNERSSCGRDSIAAGCAKLGTTPAVSPKWSNAGHRSLTT
jgi:hypothetical protein